MGVNANSFLSNFYKNSRRTKNKVRRLYIT